MTQANQVIGHWRAACSQFAWTEQTFDAPAEDAPTADSESVFDLCLRLNQICAASCSFHTKSPTVQINMIFGHAKII